SERGQRFRRGVRRLRELGWYPHDAGESPHLHRQRRLEVLNCFQLIIRIESAIRFRRVAFFSVGDETRGRGPRFAFPTLLLSARRSCVRLGLNPCPGPTSSRSTRARPVRAPSFLTATGGSPAPA